MQNKQGMTASVAKAALAMTCVASGLVSGKVSAQSQVQAAPPAEGSGSIVVTARRRSERLQDVPISVSAYSQATLDTRAVRAIDDLARIAPGITFTRNGSGTSANYDDENSDIAIRGIDSSAGSSTTGVYVDDTPIQSRHLAYGTVNAFPALFDLASVEVLRGPQGTLFGSGSEGGTVRFVSPEPSLERWQVYGRGEVGAIQNGGTSFVGGIAVGGPIVPDKLGFRLSVSETRDGGWVDRVTPATGQVTQRNANWQNTITSRLALKYTPSDTVTISPSVYFQTLHINDTAAYWPSLSNPSGGAFVNGNALRDMANDPFYIVALKVEWKPAFADITWDSSYFHRDQHAQSDYTQYDRTLFTGTSPVVLPGDAGPSYFQDKQRNIVEELKISSKDGPSRLKWTVGIFYTHTSENTPESAYDPTLNAEYGPFNPPVGANGQTYDQPIFKVVDRQIAGFGELNYKLTPQLTATAGVRVTSIRSAGTFAAGGTIVFSGMQASSGVVSESSVTPRFILNYALSHDHSLYASASEGFRPGGLNFVQANSCSTNNATYKSDTLWSYEVGSKNVIQSLGITLNASAFYINWSNIQQNVYYPACDFQQTVNLGGLHSRGFEIEGQWHASKALALAFSANYVDATYTQTVGNPLVTAGDHVPGSPFNLTGNADYTFADTGGWRPYFGSDSHSVQI